MRVGAPTTRATHDSLTYIWKDVAIGGGEQPGGHQVGRVEVKLLGVHVPRAAEKVDRREIREF